MPVCGIALLCACTATTGSRTVTMATLEDAPTSPLERPEQRVVADPQVLRELCTPLGPRLGLLQVRCQADWRRLANAAGPIGACPDLREGIVLGLACWAGTPIDGQWPVHIQAVRVCEGGGLVQADFETGSYLPDGTARLETAHVKGLGTVLAVDVNGTMFYPK